MKVKNIVKRMRKYLKFTIEFIKYFSLAPFAILKYRNNNIYLFAERGNDARDNAYHLFKYVRNNHPDIDSCYVINKNSPDYEKVAKLGKVIEYGSLQHYLIFIAAKYKISTHAFGYSTYSEFYFRFSKIIPFYGRKIYLQHGIIFNDLPQLYKEKTLVDLFTSGAKPEYEYLVDKFHYNGEIKYTGLARYDALYNLKLKNQILIMPTWRNYLSELDEKEFIESEYFKKWNNFLNNQKLLEIIEKNHINIIFYPHYEFQKYLKCFSSKSNRVIMASFKEYDVQQLLKESKLLITDYSSVFSDFAYMHKPLLYYHFDKEEWKEKHYVPGYFDYEEMGFGEVCESEEKLVDLTIECLLKDFRIDDKYLERDNKFFEIHDNNNCKRIFEEIQKI